MNTIILASSSPRRKELLTMAGIDFSVLSVQTDELIPPGTSPQKAVQMLALQKVSAVCKLQKQQGKTIIAADTIVTLDNKIFGKPHTRQEAYAMLSALSGKRHQVFTGVCVHPPKGESLTFYEKTEVEFYCLSAQEIEAYIATGEPMDKAGAYGIQGKGALLVRKIDGDFYNVMGLPIGRLVRVLHSIV